MRCWGRGSRASACSWVRTDVQEQPKGSGFGRSGRGQPLTAPRHEPRGGAAARHCRRGLVHHPMRPERRIAGQPAPTAGGGNATREPCPGTRKIIPSPCPRPAGAGMPGGCAVPCQALRGWLRGRRSELARDAGATGMVDRGQARSHGQWRQRGSGFWFFRFVVPPRRARRRAGAPSVGYFSGAHQKSNRLSGSPTSNQPRAQPAPPLKPLG